MLLLCHLQLQLGSSSTSTSSAYHQHHYREHPENDYKLCTSTAIYGIAKTAKYPMTLGFIKFLFDPCTTTATSAKFLSVA